MNTDKAAYWKERLNLHQHVEGGAFRRTYTAATTAAAASLPPVFAGARPFSSAIYFLLEHGDFSAFHRLHAEEMWHFYTGDTLTIYEIDTNGQLTEHRLGAEFEQGGRFQILIPAGHWFASRVTKPGGFTLAGCTVTPGFDFADFELARREELTAAYPQHAALIKELTRI